MKSAKDDGSDVKTILTTNPKRNDYYAMRVFGSYIYYANYNQLLMVTKTPGSSSTFLYNAAGRIDSLFVFNFSVRCCTVNTGLTSRLDIQHTNKGIRVELQWLNTMQLSSKTKFLDRKSGDDIPTHLSGQDHSLARISADIQYCPRGLTDRKFFPRGFCDVQSLSGRLTSPVKNMHFKYLKTDKIDGMDNGVSSRTQQIKT
ncbi:unnamed protein product [Mytilus edulis]|uniref:Uncharacterized protein n=1 Tax=Mytilus edulis TaxID=6550 RepID=A0A8S3TUG0_MYTED|nr:unnamed protein product [Mytilus edulis]